jgi:hypothetical protein
MTFNISTSKEAKRSGDGWERNMEGMEKRWRRFNNIKLISKKLFHYKPTRNPLRQCFEHSNEIRMVELMMMMKTSKMILENSNLMD